MKQLYVDSEIGQLRRVILSRPERALTHLTPSNCHSLLFDDVLDVEAAGEEHDVFANLLTQHGVEVLLLHNLLNETLHIAEAKQWMLATQISDYRYGPTFAALLREYLNDLPTDRLTHYLLGGLSYRELPFKQDSMLGQRHAPHDFAIEPLPNHLFMRDTSCWLYGGVVLNPMMKSARQRETNHLRAIYRWHPEFAATAFETYFGYDNHYYDNATIEGGDILVLGNKTVLIGISERTSAQGVENLAQQLFASQHVTQVIAIELPKMRACMHLDTVLTQINHDTFSIYPDIMSHHLKTWLLTPSRDHLGLQAKELPSYQHALGQCLNLDKIQTISTGGNRYQAEREQWNDANNLLTLNPNTVIGYAHNHFTNEVYDKAGVNVLTIPGNELGRGRGGARCMSCPIERAPL